VCKVTIDRLVQLWPDKSPWTFINEDGSETNEQEEMMKDMEMIMRGDSPDCWLLHTRFVRVQRVCLALGRGTVKL